MYFLPENEIKTCSVYSRLEKNFQLMRIFDVHDPEHRTWNYHSVTKYGSELIFYLINYIMQKFHVSSLITKALSVDMIVEKFHEKE